MVVAVQKPIALMEGVVVVHMAMAGKSMTEVAPAIVEHNRQIAGRFAKEDVLQD